MASAPAFQFYPQRFLASVSMWDADAVGVYIRLLSLQWDQGGLPNDLQQLTNGAGKEVPKVWEIVKTKFPVCKDGLLRNGMLEGIRQEQEAYRKRIGKARKKAASARWNNASKSNSDEHSIEHPNAHANASHIGGGDIGIGIGNNSGKERAGAKSDLFDVVTPKAEVHEAVLWPSFADFWDAYGKKRGRPNAEREWAKVNQKDREAIMRVLPDYVAATPQEFRKDPERYLKHRAWEDEIITRTTNGNGKPTLESKLASALDVALAGHRGPNVS